MRTTGGEDQPARVVELPAPAPAVEHLTPGAAGHTKTLNPLQKQALVKAQEHASQTQERHYRDHFYRGAQQCRQPADEWKIRLRANDRQMNERGAKLVQNH